MNVNPNRSSLNPDVITVCNTCEAYEQGEFKQCPQCSSRDVEIIKEDDLT